MNAQSISLNYDSLASLEQPLATEIGDVTFSLTGLADVSVVAADAEGDAEAEPAFVGNFQVAAGTQLSNRWRVGGAYFGQYATRSFATFEGREGYSDNVAGFIATSAGTFLGGNTSGQVRELVRRRRGAGHGALAYDDFFGKLDDWGGAYTGRFGPSVIGLAFDDDGDFDLGAVLQRPSGHRDYRLAGRFTRGTFVPSGSGRHVSTTGVEAVAEVTYGSTMLDLGVGYERLDLHAHKLDRLFVSAGVRKQAGAIRVSCEGHYGEIDGRSEVAASLGLAYAVARGLSLNFGANYRNAALGAFAVQTDAENELELIGSARFSF